MNYNKYINFEAYAEKLSCALGLKRQLVGVTFFYSQSEYDLADDQEIKAPTSYCAMVRMMTLGHARKAKFEHVSCPGAQRALGFVPVDEEFSSGKRYKSLGLYKDIQCAKETAAEICLLKDKIYGFSLRPLGTCVMPPHVIISICDPNQAMRLVQGYIYSFGPVQPMGSMGMQGVCAELTVRPHQTQEINVSLLCSNTRYTCSWEDGELGVSLPYSAFVETVEGVISTINSAESDKKKESLMKRADEMNLKMDVQLGTAYYSPKASKRAPVSKKIAPSKVSNIAQVSTKTVCAPTKPEKLSISVKNVTKAHSLKSNEKIHVVDNISLDIYDQEFVTIVGPSGCGKSTLLSLMAGLSEPDSGQIIFHGKSGDKSNFNLGYISQIDTLLPWRTVQGNVEIGLELRGIPKAERKIIVAKLMKQVGLNGFEKSYPFELSGGMKKRAAVIRTLAYDPDIIFMDEPFVGLDVQTRDELEEDILNIWHEHRKTIILVTHDLTEAITLSDRVILLTARPAVIKSEYEVPLPRPRSIVEIKFTNEFVKLHKQIWNDLSAEVLKSSKDNDNE